MQHKRILIRSLLCHKILIIAYVATYAFYGICGWIEEWVNRGMPESEKEMMALLEAMQKEEKK